MNKTFVVRHNPDHLFYARPVPPRLLTQWLLTLVVAAVALALVILARNAGIEFAPPAEFPIALVSAASGGGA